MLLWVHTILENSGATFPFPILISDYIAEVNTVVYYKIALFNVHKVQGLVSVLPSVPISVFLFGKFIASARNQLAPKETPRSLVTYVFYFHND